MSLFELYKGDSMDTGRREKLFKFHRYLTEKILGEKWYSIEPKGRLLPKTEETGFNRTFDNWQDYGDVVTAMSTSYYTDHLDGYSLMHRFIEFILGVGDKCRNRIPSVLADSSFIQPYTITMTTHVNKYFTNKDLFFTTLQEWWEKEGK